MQRILALAQCARRRANLRAGGGQVATESKVPGIADLLPRDTLCRLCSRATHLGKAWRTRKQAPIGAGAETHEHAALANPRDSQQQA